MSDIGWVAAHIAGSCDLDFENHLKEKEIEAYAPKKRIWVRPRRSQKRVLSPKPVFSGYVFIKAFAFLPWEIMRCAPGFRYIVSMCGFPLVASDDQISEIMKMECEGLFDDRSVEFISDQSVIIRSGLCAGMSGVIKSFRSNREGDGFAEILLTTSKKVKIPLSFLRDIDEDSVEC